MHALVAVMDGHEAQAQARARGVVAMRSSDDHVPRGGCGIGQLFRGKQKRGAAMNGRGQQHS